MSAVASLISESGDFSLSHAVDLDHYGGARSETRALIQELPQSGAQLKSAFSDSGWTAWTLIEPGSPPVEFLTESDTGRRWRVLFQEDRTAGAKDPMKTFFLQLIAE